LSAEDLSAIYAATYAIFTQVGTTWAGHLPASIPLTDVSPIADGLVQICHGTPGAIILLAALRAFHPESFPPGSNNLRVLFEAERKMSDTLWTEGLLKKGMGVCHGLAGNAWSLLLLHVADRSTFFRSSTWERQQQHHPSNAGPRVDPDIHLSRALSFFVQSAQLPPLEYPTATVVELQARKPDSPYSLMEGLAGAVCAWSDACVYIRCILNPEDTDDFNPHVIFGVPGLGGLGRKMAF
jgi:hypothetical protein